MRSGDVNKNKWYIVMNILIFIYVLTIGYYNIFLFCYGMNSDIASEALLGREIAVTKQWIPESWITSTEAKIIHTPQVTALLYCLTGNLVLSTGLSFFLFALILFASMCYFVSKLHINDVYEKLFLILSLALPTSHMISGLLYFEGCYYSVVTAVMFFSFGNMIMIEKTMKINKVLFVCDYFLAFIMGLQGMRGILVIYGPIIAVIILYLFRNMIFKLKLDKNRVTLLLYAVGLFVASYIGTRFPLSIGQGITSNFRKGIIKLFKVVVPNIIDSLNLYASTSIQKCLMSILVVLAFICLIKLIKKYFSREEKFDIEDWIYTFLWASPAMTGIFIAFTTVEDCPRYHYIYIFVLAYTPIYFYKNVYKVNKHLMCIFVTCTVISSYINCYGEVLCRDRSLRTDEEIAIEYLLEQDVYNGCATFNVANKMTVMSNEQINIVPIDSLKNMQQCKWLSSSNWYPPNTNASVKTAYIARQKEVDDLEYFIQNKTEHVIEKKEIGSLTIYILDYNYSHLGE